MIEIEHMTLDEYGNSFFREELKDHRLKKRIERSPFLLEHREIQKYSDSEGIMKFTPVKMIGHSKGLFFERGKEITQSGEELLVVSILERYNTSVAFAQRKVYAFDTNGIFKQVVGEWIISREEYWPASSELEEIFEDIYSINSDWFNEK